MQPDPVRTVNLIGAPAQLPEPTHEPERARELADEILSRPRYEAADDRSGALDRVGEWLADQFSRLASSVGVDAVFPTWLAWLILAALLVLAAALLVRLQRRRGPRPRHAQHPGTMIVEENEGPVDWSAQAEVCEAEGQWAEGLRCRYRALIADLVERGVIGDAAGRTAGEYVREVADARPAAAAAFAAATELFEHAWYGGASTGPSERDRLRAFAAAVVRLGDESPAGDPARPRHAALRA